MRNEDWLQKLLYLIMAALAIYILYKGGSILLGSRPVQEAMREGTLQRPLEDAAVRTYLPGYTAAVEERSEENWIARWMKPVIPVYSYLAENGEVLGTETEIDGINQKADDTSSTEVNIAKTNEAEQIMTESNGTGIEKETDLQQTSESQTDAAQPAVSRLLSDSLRSQLSDFDYLLSNYYTVDGGTSADEGLLDADELLDTDLSLIQDPAVPQILIYHTHAQEAFADSREGAVEDTIVGMGEILAEHLRAYGYNVIHDTGVYDLIDGVLDRSAAYDHARAAVETILAEDPTIEVIIDLHRDGVDGMKFVTEIGGKPVSRIMFFNGISRNSENQALEYLPNEYISENLAFSLQLELLAREKYPDFTRNIYLKAERFNLHLRPRSLLIEAGTQLNTVEEEQNAMELLAELLHQVLAGV